MPSPKKSVTKKAPAKKVPAKKTPTKKVATKKVAKIVKEPPEVEMKVFTCKACKKKFPDMNLYFYGNVSEKCMWCRKFPSRNNPKT